MVCCRALSLPINKYWLLLCHLAYCLRSRCSHDRSQKFSLSLSSRSHRNSSESINTHSSISEIQLHEENQISITSYYILPAAEAGYVCLKVSSNPLKSPSSAFFCDFRHTKRISTFEFSCIHNRNSEHLQNTHIRPNPDSSMAWVLGG